MDDKESIEKQLSSILVGTEVVFQVSRVSVDSRVHKVNIHFFDLHFKLMAAVDYENEKIVFDNDRLANLIELNKENLFEFLFKETARILLRPEQDFGKFS